MSGLTNVSDRIEEFLTVLKRVTETVFQAALLVGCVCILGLIVAGTYGLLHQGDDFGVDLDGNGRGSGDVIVLSPLR